LLCDYSASETLKEVVIVEVWCLSEEEELIIVTAELVMLY
jgi:hypothetical protein